MLQAWKYLTSVSRVEFQEAYDRLGVRIKEMGESYYNPYLKFIVAKMDEAGLLKTDKGAKVVFVPKFKNPLIIQKSDGGFSYDVTEVAAIWYRLTELKCDRVIYVFDTNQDHHFKRVIEIARVNGWHVPPKTRIEHMGIGILQGENGKKITTRDGYTDSIVSFVT